jgi:acetoin utilization deacetylase AcuC-like enzyme
MNVECGETREAGKEVQETMTAGESPRTGPWLIAHPDYEFTPNAMGLNREKFTRLRARIVEEGFVEEKEFVEPGPPEYRDLVLAHDRTYLEDVLNLRQTQRTLFAGIPLNAGTRDLYLNVVGGAVRCVDLALEEGAALYLGGGGIHAFRDHAEGFCFLNDGAVALLRARTLGKIEKALVVSGDAHQPDGLIRILEENPDLLTFSVFQDTDYPYKRVKGDWDLTICPETGDREYLDLIRSVLKRILDTHEVDLILYIASVDPLKQDASSRLQISMKGLCVRDDIVAGECFKRGIPLAVLLPGSAVRDVDAAIEAHMNTVRTVKEYRERELGTRRSSRSQVEGVPREAATG